jgi:hypothetical protein
MLCVVYLQYHEYVILDIYYSLLYIVIGHNCMIGCIVCNMTSMVYILCYYVSDKYMFMVYHTYLRPL